MKQRNKNIFIYLFFAAISLCTLFWDIDKSYSFLGSGDYLSPIEITEQIQRRLHVYEPFFVGGNDTTYLVAHLFPFYTFFGTMSLIGISPLYGTLFFISAIIFLSQISFYTYTRYILKEKFKLLEKDILWITIIGSVFYGFSPYITTTISPGHTLLLLMYATFPAILKNLEKILSTSKKTRKDYLKLFLLFALNASAYANFGLIYITVGILFLYTILHTVLYRDKIIGNTKKLAQILLTLFASNAWWLLPYLWNLQKHYALNSLSSTTSGMNEVFLQVSTANATIGKMLLGRAETLFYMDIFPNTYYLGIIALITFSCISFFALKSIVSAKKYTHIILLTWLCIIGFFITKGAQEPFQEIFFALFDHIPGFQIFRRPVSKFFWFFILILLNLAMIGIALTAKKQKRLSQIAKIILSIGAITLVIFFAKTPHHRPFNIPQDYFTIREQLHSENVQNVLLLPGTYGVHPRYNESVNEYKGFDFIKFIWDFGVIQPDSSAYSTENPYKPITNELFANIQTEKSICTQTKALGITHIIVRNDIHEELRAEGNPTVLSQKISRHSEIENHTKYENIDLFSIQDSCKQNMITLKDSKNTLEYSLINPSLIQVTVDSISEEEEITFLKNFHPSWKLYLIPYKDNGVETNTQNIYKNSWDNTFQSISLLWRQSDFNDSHKIGNDYANSWTISKSYIQENYNEDYYKINKDGSLSIKIAISYSTQKLVYIGFIITILTLTAFIGKIIKDKKNHGKA